MENLSWWWLFYPLLGVLVGFLAGLLGVGGGLVTVPLLLFINEAQSFPNEHLYKATLASSMAAIAFTSFSSMRSHQQQGNIDWLSVKALVPGLLLGAMVGGLTSAWIPDKLLVSVFIIFALYTALQMFFGLKFVAHNALPHQSIIFTFATFTGILSAIISAGGGFLVVPFLSQCNIVMKRAVATSAACGFPIAIFGTLGYIISGWQVEGLPAYSLGWVHLPSALGVALTSVFMAGIGARLSGKLAANVLKKIFAVMLLLVVVSMSNRYF